MPVPTPNISRAEKKAAALASARRWQEERKSPLAKIMSKSPDENRVKIKGTPRRLDKEKALARARERDYEQRKAKSPNTIPEAVEMFRVRVDTSINTVNKAVTTIPLDKVNNHFSHRIITNYDFYLRNVCMFDLKSYTQH